MVAYGDVLYERSLGSMPRDLQRARIIHGELGRSVVGLGFHVFQ